MWRSARNFLGQKLHRDPDRWYPLLTVYYLTYRCDFFCPYCSDGAGRPYHQLREASLELPELRTLLGRIRRYCDHLVITGGEPLQYPYVPEAMQVLKSLGFRSLIFTTNGHNLEPQLPALAATVSHLVFSLDTLNRSKADKWFGRGRGTLENILGNIRAAGGWANRSYDIVISSVATPDNLDDLFEVYDYCQRNGYRFAVCPQLEGVYPHHALKESATYRRLFDFLCREKQKGGRINGSLLYLQHLRDFTEFDCIPSTVLAVSPSGQVFYPCLERGTVAGNLLQTPNLHQIRRQGKEQHGPEPRCDNRCHSACALGFALALRYPKSVIQDLYLDLGLGAKATGRSLVS